MNKTILQSLTILVMLGCFSVSIKAAPQLQTVNKLDLRRYQGTWHQLAAIPASFQRDCVGYTKAEYKLRRDGEVEVTNSCLRSNGKRKSSDARARINPDFNRSSKLEVTFVNIFGWVWAFAGDYWVTYIDKDYQVAVVGDPKFEYGWILSRKETLSKKQYRKIARVIEKRGYDSCKFLLSTTKKQKFRDAEPLCRYVQ